MGKPRSVKAEVAAPQLTDAQLLELAKSRGLIKAGGGNAKVVSLSEVQAQIDAQQALLNAFTKASKAKQSDPAVKAEFGRALRNAAQGNYNRGRNVHEKGYVIVP